MRSLKLGLIGDPVAHSLSPALHRGFLAEAGLSGSYDAVRVTLTEVHDALSSLGGAGYLGLNVTTPLKSAVLAVVGASDVLVQQLGAANTLLFDAERSYWWATNTDGIGACVALSTALGDSLPGKRIAVLGLGPTGRAARLALEAEGAFVYAWTRSQPWEELPAQLDAVLSALPPEASFPEDIRQLLLRTEVVVDANYGPRATLGVRLGRSVFTGETMLEAQARASFEIWRRAAEGPGEREIRTPETF